MKKKKASIEEIIAVIKKIRDDYEIGERVCEKVLEKYKSGELTYYYETEEMDLYYLRIQIEANIEKTLRDSWLPSICYGPRAGNSGIFVELSPQNTLKPYFWRVKRRGR
ncbi:MAG: hypothetical protein QG620_142 [Patescibacteria group bacterium]|nr:hypothetical protein [Patescibacteria group bacterium]